MGRLRIPLPAKIAGSLLLLAFVVSRIDAASLLRAVSQSNPYLLMAAIVLYFSGWFLNTYKWQVILTSLKAKVAYLALLHLTFVASFYSLVLPGQVGGEVIKSISLARMGVRGATSGISVAADRITGLAALLMLGTIGAVLAPPQFGDGSQLLVWLVGLAVLLTLLAVILVTGRGSGAISAISTRFIGSTRPVLGKIAALLARFPSETRSASSLVAPLLLSAVFQAILVYSNLLICRAFGIQIGFLQLAWIVALVSLLQALPISIAGIGVREGTFVYLMHLQGADTASALALSLTVFGIQIMLGAVGGLLQLKSLLCKPQLRESNEHI